jgi:hypothetical protein
VGTPTARGLLLLRWCGARASGLRSKAAGSPAPKAMGRSPGLASTEGVGEGVGVGEVAWGVALRAARVGLSAKRWSEVRTAAAQWRGSQ